jgi:hypothetical protein
MIFAKTIFTFSSLIHYQLYTTTRASLLIMVIKSLTVTTPITVTKTAKTVTASMTAVTTRKV